VIWDKVKDYTLTEKETVDYLVKAVDYVHDNNIEGDFVECGVWKGGSCMAAAYRFNELEDYRKIWMYDTFKGMTPPCELDVNNFTGKSMPEGKWECSLIDVTVNMEKTNYKGHIVYVMGDVMETLQDCPEKISILRLDTDFYASTKFELEQLYPLVSDGGVIIIDDYLHWRGSKVAVDKYRKENNINSIIEVITEKNAIAWIKR